MNPTNKISVYDNKKIGFLVLSLLLGAFFSCSQKKAAKAVDKYLQITKVELVMSLPPFPDQEPGYTYFVYAKIRKNDLYSFNQATIKSEKSDLYFNKENTILTEAKTPRPLKSGDDIILWSYFSSSLIHKQKDTLGRTVYDPANLEYTVGKNQKIKNLRLHQPDTVKVYLAE